VFCYENNPHVRKALEEEGKGRVLVVDAGASMRCAVLGDNLAANAQKNGWSVSWACWGGGPGGGWWGGGLNCFARRSGQATLCIERVSCLTCEHSFLAARCASDADPPAANRHRPPNQASTHHTHPPTGHYRQRLHPGL